MENSGIQFSMIAKRDKEFSVEKINLQYNTTLAALIKFCIRVTNKITLEID